VTKTQRGKSIDAGMNMHYINDRMCPDVDGSVFTLTIYVPVT